MSESPDEHLDVLIVGAGISGIGAAVHLTRRLPDTTFAVLEAKHSYGGTWITHTYPGIRSDSDLHTFGYVFKPWRGKPIAKADEILAYMGEVIDEHDLARHIRYHHTIHAAEWSSARRCWTVAGTDTSRGEPFTITARFLYMCQGYYRHSVGHQPTWPGMERFGGQIIHPQNWPDDLDYVGKKVAVIGSGATAATLIPAMAPDVELITMVQRSPTYFRSGRNVNELAELLREVDTPEEWTHEIVRRRMLFDSSLFTDRCFSEPEVTRTELLEGVRSRLAPEQQHLVEEAFTPRYLPWRERIAFVPDGDLFEAINSGKATVATGEIATFTETGLELTDGRHIDADIVITATGFEVNVLGDIAFTIDARAARLPRHRHVSGCDVHRHPEHGVGVRLLPCRLDAARRHDRRIRVPVARPHGGQRCRGRRPAAAPRRGGHAAAPVGRSGELQPRVFAAWPAPTPPAGRPRPVAAHAGLLAREGLDPERRPRRRGARLRVAAAGPDRRVTSASGGKRDGRPFVAI